IVFINCLIFLFFAFYAFAKPKLQYQQADFPVSVIICSKNEAENLKKHIPLWLEQQYTNFELIHINDASIDETLDVIEAFAEAEKLHTHLPLWLEQQYDNFELILINDASIDETLVVIEAFAETDKRIKIVDVKNNEPFWANNKYALTLGIKKAKNNYPRFTDA